jgi:hypothetical protein
MLGMTMSQAFKDLINTLPALSVPHCNDSAHYKRPEAGLSTLFEDVRQYKTPVWCMVLGLVSGRHGNVAIWQWSKQDYSATRATT